MIRIIVCKTRQGVIGNSGKPGLLWKIPSEMDWFKRTTMKPGVMGTKGTNIVLMGRITFETLGCKALTGRTNIVISSKLDDNKYSNVMIRKSLDEGIVIAERYVGKDIYIIGGLSIYRQTLAGGFALEVLVSVLKEQYDDIKGDLIFPHLDHYKEDSVIHDCHEFSVIKYVPIMVQCPRCNNMYKYCKLCNGKKLIPEQLALNYKVREEEQDDVS